MSRATVLRNLRTSAGLTQSQLAARIGITPSVLSAYENGKREPRVDVFFRAVEAAGFVISLDRPGQKAPGLKRVVPDAETRARTLIPLWGLAMTGPAKERGPLRFPPFQQLVGPGRP